MELGGWAEGVEGFYRRALTPDVGECFRRVHSTGSAEVEEGEVVVLRVRLKVEVGRIE